MSLPLTMGSVGVLMREHRESLGIHRAIYWSPACGDWIGLRPALRILMEGGEITLDTPAARRSLDVYTASVGNAQPYPTLPSTVTLGGLLAGRARRVIARVGSQDERDRIEFESEKLERRDS